MPDNWSSIPVPDNKQLDAATSKALGFKSVTVLKGDYKVDYSKNKNGTVLLNIEARN